MNLKTTITSAAFGAAVMFGGAASAGTITLDGSDFTITGGQLQGGNCPISAPCLKLNKNDELLVTYTGGPFTLTGFSYTLQGDPSSFDAIANMQTGYSSDPWSNPSTQVYTADLTGNAVFEDIFQFKIQPTGTGTFRIGGFTGTAPMAAVPLPAAGMLLLTALGGFAAFGRRKA